MFIDTSNLTQGIYIHIPHCIQKCHYCDFPTVLLEKGPDLDTYTEQILDELSLKHLSQSQALSSIYFGGGTPSLLGPKRVAKILSQIKSIGYKLQPNAEISFEVNPGTLSPSDIKDLVQAGVNRFSLGVQTFNDDILKLIGREHSAQDAKETLSILSSLKLNFSADLILGLPQMNFPKFQNDVKTLLKYRPQHLSIYLLTVPELHFLNKQAPQDDDLEELLNKSQIYLKEQGFYRYEISNYVYVDGQPSWHNLLHWNDRSYWGVGMGAHSYFKDLGKWGTRFWNPRAYKTYVKQLEKRLQTKALPDLPQIEALQLHESITDFCVTHLRQSLGLPAKRLEMKFPSFCVHRITDKLQKLSKQGYIDYGNNVWQLSLYGQKFADRVFREICFTENELERVDV